jgi:hypothetical protein
VSRAIKYVVFFVSLAVCIALLFSQPIQTIMKGLYLNKAKIRGAISWREAVFVRSVLATNESSAPAHIGRLSEDGRDVLVIVTKSHMYYVDRDQDGTLFLRRAVPYHP